MTQSRFNAFLIVVSIWLISQLFYFQYFSPPLIFSFIGDLNPERLIFLLLISYFLYKKLSGQIFPCKINLIEFYMIFFFIICTISIYANESEYHSENFGRFMRLVYIGLYPYITYYILRRVPYSLNNVNILVITICFIGVYLAVTGFLEHYKYYDFIWPSYIIDRHVGTQYGRVRGPFVQSAFMAKALIVSFSFMLIYSSQRIGLKRYLMLFFSILAVGAIYFTYTRGPWIGFAIVISSTFLIKTNLRKFIAVIMIFIFIGVFFGFGSKLAFFGNQSLFEKRKDTVSNRYVTWVTSIDMIKDKPILGIGWGLFNEKWDRYFVDKYEFEWGTFDGSHNLYFTTTAELGILGASIFFLIFFLLIKDCIIFIRELGHKDEFMRMFAIVSLANLFMHLFTAFFSDPRNSPYQNTIIFMCMGIVSSMRFSLNDSNF